LNGGSSEKLLLAAVLVRAVRDFVIHSRGNSIRDRRIAAAAREWIFDDPEPDAENRGHDPLGHFMSFTNICLVMNLDREQVRRRILVMQPEETRGLRCGMLPARG
jgi:hypothetical protein